MLDRTADFSEALVRQLVLISVSLQHSTVVREDNRQGPSGNKFVSGSARYGIFSHLSSFEAY